MYLLLFNIELSYVNKSMLLKTTFNVNVKCQLHRVLFMFQHNDNTYHCLMLCMYLYVLMHVACKQLFVWKFFYISAPVIVMGDMAIFLNFR